MSWSSIVHLQRRLVQNGASIVRVMRSDNEKRIRTLSFIDLDGEGEEIKIDSKKSHISQSGSNSLFETKIIKKYTIDKARG